MIPAIKLFDKFSDLPITRGEISAIVNSIVDLFVTVNRNEKSQQQKIIALNEIHWKAFQYLTDPECKFYKGLDSQTRKKLIKLIELEREQRKKSWTGMITTAIQRVKLYPRLFKITDADIKQHTHFVEGGTASFRKIGILVNM